MCLHDRYVPEHLAGARAFGKHFPDGLSSATDEFIAFIQEHGITFEQAAAARQSASDAHNREETPNFAVSIERHALKQA
jgi:hypothetical protein